MIELLEQDLVTLNRHSSKGNQLKWKNGNVWYKADYTGYEGLAEYMVSRLLQKSSLGEAEFLLYDLEEIKYRKQIYQGVRSFDFLEDDWQIITLQRLYRLRCGQNLYESVWKLSSIEERLLFLTKEVERLTGIKKFGEYMAKLLTIDAFFLNEDRHFHNIAVLMNGQGDFRLCPIFDNGASLLSDTKIDYPLTEETLTLMSEVKAKSISGDFDQQLDAAEKLFGSTISFQFDKKEVDKLLENATIYQDEEKERVRTILYQQMRKYTYLFSK